ncbi:hypothetical protein KFE98_01025 [bacterium SCSIO 12741]|nr:hypothetical protein KFE98_01025 [bacterium SCSIO 12741]
MKKSLRVSPIKKYRVPKYPSYRGRDPLHSQSGPLTKIGYYSAALLGAVGLFSFTSEGEKREPENPIRFSELGLPHTYAMFGTGLPARLEREAAMEIIEKVFKENGIALTPNFPIDDGKTAFHASGFNAEKGIGYVWLDNQSADISCFNAWWGPADEVLLKEDLKALKDFEEGEPEWEELRKFREKLFKNKNYYRLLAIKSSSWNNKELEQEIEKYIIDHKPSSDPEYGQEILDKYDREMLDIKEVKQVTEEPDYSIAAFSQYANYSTYSGWGNRHSKSKAEALEHLEELVEDYIDWARSEGRL